MNSVRGLSGFCAEFSVVSVRHAIGRGLGRGCPAAQPERIPDAAYAETPRSVRALAAPWILSMGFENCMAPLSTPWLPRYLLEAAAGALSGCYRTRLLFRPLLDVAVPQHVGRGACTGASVEVRWIHWCALFLQLCYKGGNFQLHGFKTGKKLQKLSLGTPPSDVNSPSGTLYLFSDLR